MCHLYPYKNVKLLWKFFYINICGFIGRGKFLYETRVLDSSYLRYKIQLPTSDSTEITAGGIKVTLGVLYPLTPHSGKNTFILNASSSSSFRDIMGFQNYIRKPCTTWTPLAEKNYTQIEYFTIFNCIFNFNFLALVVSETLGWSQIYIRGVLRPWMALAEKCLYPKRVLWHI